jgi:nucleoid-associated protein YgaU
MKRYKNRQKATNKNPQYENLLEERSVKQIEQYRTKQLEYPSDKQIDSLEVTKYYWQNGDTYYKVAAKFYGDYTYWWVLAQFNKIPFEGDLKAGNVIFIPRPLNRVLQFLG